MSPPGATGTRPVVLLLHGQPGSAHDWSAVVRRLRPDAEVIAIDRPGWDGGRARGLAANARAAAAALDARGVTRAVVAGHSFGAAVAAWLAATVPHRVSGLVLAAPAANVASLYPVDRWLAAPVAGDVCSAAAMIGIGVLLSLPGAHRWLTRRGLDGGYLRAVRAQALQPALWRAYASEQRALVHDLPALERMLNQITAPTTILAGRGDRIVPPRAARELAGQIPGAHLEVAERAGHLLPHYEPDLVAGAIRRVMGP